VLGESSVSAELVQAFPISTSGTASRFVTACRPARWCWARRLLDKAQRG